MGLTLLTVFLLGVALSMDAFAVSVTSGLIYTDLNKKRILFIALTFGIMQGVMPLLGYWIVEIFTIILDTTAGQNVGAVASKVVSWIAFILLIALGIKMIIEGIKGMRTEEELKNPKCFKIKEILYFGVATSIDALGAGVALHAGVSSNLTIWLHILIIMLCTFTISLLGILLGKQIEKLFKGKIEITSIIGGCILIILGIWIITSHYL